MLATCTLTRPAWPRSTHVATTHDVARRNPAVVNPRRTAVAVKAVVGDADGYRVVQRRVVLGAAAACGVAVWMPLTAQADEAVALDTITDRVYLDVAVDNKIIVRPFAIPMEPLLPRPAPVLAAGFLPVETSRASPPHMSREDGLIHPADTSRSNLAAGGKHHSKHQHQSQLGVLRPRPLRACRAASSLGCTATPVPSVRSGSKTWRVTCRAWATEEAPSTKSTRYLLPQLIDLVHALRVEK